MNKDKVPALTGTFLKQSGTDFSAGRPLSREPEKACWVVESYLLYPQATPSAVKEPQDQPGAPEKCGTSGPIPDLQPWNPHFNMMAGVHTGV